MLIVRDVTVYADRNGNDVCAVEFTKIEICRSDEVPEAYALSENDGTYDD